MSVAVTAVILCKSIENNYCHDFPCIKERARLQHYSFWLKKRSFTLIYGASVLSHNIMFNCYMLWCIWLCRLHVTIMHHYIMNKKLFKFISPCQRSWMRLVGWEKPTGCLRYCAGCGLKAGHHKNKVWFLAYWLVHNNRRLQICVTMFVLADKLG